MSEIDTILFNRSTNTVGYSESGNKEEFKKGAKIAISKAIDHFQPIIDSLRSSIEYGDDRLNELRIKCKNVAIILDEWKDF